MKNNNKGISLVALTIAIVILIIFAGIAIYGGGDTIKKAQVEELKTNMLLMQAKAKEYVEDATFKMGIDPNQEKKDEVRNNVYVEEAKLEKANDVPGNLKINNNETCYWLTNEAKEQWGLR